MKFTGERFIPTEMLSKDEIGFEHLHRYHSIAKLIKNKVVLDIACGEGYGSAIMAVHATSVVGVDIDEECIKGALEQYATCNNNLQFRYGSADAIPFGNNEFDVVISFETVEHLSSSTQEQFMQEIKRVLRLDGILIISTPDKKNYSERYSLNNSFHQHEFYREEFNDFIKNHFAYCTFFEQGYEIVGIISNPESESNSSINICNLQKSDTKNDIARKYIIAVASDSQLSYDLSSLSSIVPKVDKDYLTLMDRLIVMNKEIESLGEWGTKLNDKVLEDELKIESQNKTISLQSESIQKFSIEKNKKNILEKQLSETRKKLAGLETANLQLKTEKIIVETELSDTTRSLKGSLEELNYLKSTVKENKVKEIQLQNEIQTLTRQFREQQLEEQKSVAQNNLLIKTLEEKDSLLSKTIAMLHKLETVIEDNVKKINRQEQLLIQQSSTIQTLNDYKKKSLDESQDLQQKLREKEFLIDELHQKVHQLYQEVNIAKERLSEIYDSDGWSLLSKYYSLKGKVLPESSIQYKRVKTIFNYLRFKPNLKIPRSHTASSQQNILPAAMEKSDAIFHPLEVPYFDHPTVSIIIPVYNAWEMNYQCIESIICNTHGIAYEVILADDCSTDGTKHCSDIIQNIIHIRNEKNLGFLHNCNNASKSARGKYILFLNNDTKVNPNWLSPLVSLIESDNTIGMVGPKLMYPDGRLQEAGGIIWNDSSGWNYGHNQNPDLPEFNYVKEVDYISGACIMISQKIWEKLGGFDERYSPAYCEDSDFAFTLRSLGYKVMFQPLSEVIHYEGYSHGTDNTLNDNTSSVKSFQKINNQKLREKWAAVLLKDHFPNAQNVFYARDKSKNKKTILVIDHYVPHFDQDAGSKTTFQYLELLSSLGLNIKFIGDNFFKHEPYTTTLQQMGIEVLYGSWYRDNWQQWIKDNSKHIDYVYINRPHISIKYIDFIKEFTKATILYYGHDLHFIREEMQYKIQKDPKLLESAAKWKKTELYLFEKADIILTPSEDEKTIIYSLNPSFRVEAILPYFFKKSAAAITNFSERKNILFVGGFNHTPNLDAVEWFCREVWPLVVPKLPGIKFIVVGSNPPDNIKNLKSDSVEIKGFVSEQELQSIYKEAKIVVIPLRYGAGVKGKTIEAIYYGLPTVSTSFGVEGMPGNYNSFINPYNESEDFADELVRLYKDTIACENISLKSTNYVNQHFTYEAAAVKMKDMLNIEDK